MSTAVILLTLIKLLNEETLNTNRTRLGINGRTQTILHEVKIYHAFVILLREIRLFRRKLSISSILGMLLVLNRHLVSFSHGSSEVFAGNLGTWRLINPYAQVILCDYLLQSGL